MIAPSTDTLPHKSRTGLFSLSKLVLNIISFLSVYFILDEFWSILFWTSLLKLVPNIISFLLVYFILDSVMDLWLIDKVFIFEAQIYVEFIYTSYSMQYNDQICICKLFK